ncbi:hypothetical protein J4207_02585 [Candidatus Woesearchaeota archaeon]|nr:hypothetical protein [Candidatus Woesearchaeota archaeon]
MHDILVFDEHSKEDIIKALGLKVNSTGELIDNEGKVLNNSDFETIKMDEFGGMLKGSKIPIKNNTLELVKYFVKKKD